jgi:hypothetical protein
MVPQLLGRARRNRAISRGESRKMDDFKAEIERQRGLLATLTPHELKAKEAEVEKWIAGLDDDEVHDEMVWQMGRKPEDARDLIVSGLLHDEAIKRRILVPLTRDIAEAWIDRWEREKKDEERIATRH